MVTHIFKEEPEQFLRGVYGTTLGDLRVDNLCGDIEEVLAHNPNVKTVLDIGSGHAPVTLRLMQRFKGLQVHLVDPSKPLLERALSDAMALGIEGSRLQVTQADLSTVIRRWKEFKSDLVLCHAVANWSDNPKRFVESLVSLAMNSSTCVSLVVGASIGKALRFADQGNLRDAFQAAVRPGAPVGSLLGKELVRPLDPDAVVRWVKRSGCDVVLRRGVRVLADLVPSEALEDPRVLSDLRRIEDHIRKTERFWRLGQLVHVVFRRPQGGVSRDEGRLKGGKETQGLLFEWDKGNTSRQGF